VEKAHGDFLVETTPKHWMRLQEPATNRSVAKRSWKQKRTRRESRVLYFDRRSTDRWKKPGGLERQASHTRHEAG